MAMQIDWEYFFPDVYFKHDRFQTWSKEDISKIIDEDGNWNPQKDFEFHLQKMKVDKKYFDEKNLSLFPKGFHKPLYSITLFEEERVKLLSRVKINYGEGLKGFDDDGMEIISYKILLDGIDEKVDVESETIGNNENKFHVRCNKNLINCHRFNAINILYDWLLSLNPTGTFKNKWQIFAYGITEYDETISYVDTFIEEKQNQLSISGLDNLNNNKIINRDITPPSNNEESSVPEILKDLGLEKNTHSTTTPEKIKKLLNEWNPFL
ncbi:hypothetical protein HON86_01280 [Candidatus Woesearchaeota archaeon]|jgi:hypothetical protein|nr:hypothetical protein [archaeon]MBT4835233.1 hypothetical protein [Candidatus Woesearchaeota archaeon]MBT5422860.1 hypothetical protein [archaeon]